MHVRPVPGIAQKLTPVITAPDVVGGPNCTWQFVEDVGSFGNQGAFQLLPLLVPAAPLALVPAQAGQRRRVSTRARKTRVAHFATPVQGIP
eukprot:2316081-Rhodomonas_salina.3